MLKLISVSVLALAVAGFAGSVAASETAAPVNVNVNVLPTVSAWANDLNVTLELAGGSAENKDASASSLGVINNVNAKIDAAVTGTLSPSINFFIFNTGDETSANAAMVANANAPANAQVWTSGTLGTSKTIIASTGTNLNISNKPIVYAADAPNALPAVAEFDLVVTYTISSL